MEFSWSGRKATSMGTALVLALNSLCFGLSPGLTGAVKPQIKKLDQKIQAKEAASVVLSTVTATTFQITGTVFKGPVVSGVVSLYSIKSDGSKDNLLATTTTDGGSGTFTFNLTSAPSYPLLIEATAGNSGQAYNEPLDTYDFMSASAILTALLPDQTVQAAVTPLTHMAATRARALASAGTTPLATAIKSAHIGVGKQYNVGDVLGTIPIVVSGTVSNGWTPFGHREQRRYALIMAAIAQVANGINVYPMDLADAFALDASDGVLDGKNGSAAIAIPTKTNGTTPLTAAMSTTGLQTALNTFLASAKNHSQISAMNFPTTATTIGINGAGAFYVTSTALPAFVAGTTGSASLTAEGGTPSYTCALKTGSSLPTGFQLAANCVLTGTPAALPNGTSMTISPLFTVTVADSDGHTQDVTTSVTIVSPPPIFSLKANPTPLTEGLDGCTSLVDLTSASGGVSPYNYMIGSFADGAPPIGTTMNELGYLCGRPMKAGTYHFKIFIVDAAGSSSSQLATIVVKESVKYPLRVTINQAGPATGSGTVSWHPQGFTCANTACSASFSAGDEVWVSASPSSGSNFNGWSGACSGNQTCAITMSGPQSVDASFVVTPASGGGGGGGGGGLAFCRGFNSYPSDCKIKCPNGDSDCKASDPNGDYSAYCSGPGNSCTGGH